MRREPSSEDPGARECRDGVAKRVEVIVETAVEQRGRDECAG